MPYTVRPLDASTGDTFAELVERNNGIFGECWCIGYHLGPGDKGTDYRAAKEARVGGLVEAIPEVTAGREAQGRFLFSATVELFEEGPTPHSRARRDAGIGRRRGPKPAATANPHPPAEVSRQQNYDRREHVPRVPGRIPVDGVDVIPGQVTCAHPYGDPDHGAKPVVDQEAAHVHAGDASDDAVEFAQPDNKPGDHHQNAAEFGDSSLCAVEMMLTDERISAVPQYHSPAAEPADRVANLRAGKAADHRDHANDRNVQASAARAREDGPRDERELARHHGNADVLQEQQQGDRPVAVGVKRASDWLQEAGQRCRAGQGTEHADLPGNWAQRRRQSGSPRRMAYRSTSRRVQPPGC